MGTLLAHLQPSVCLHPNILFCCAALQPLCPKPVALHGVVVMKMQDPALGLVEAHIIGLSSLIQPIQIPLQGLSMLKQISFLPAWCHLQTYWWCSQSPHPGDIKQDWPQYWLLGNTIHDQSPAGFTSIHLYNSIHHQDRSLALQLHYTVTVIVILSWFLAVFYSAVHFNPV